MTDKTLIVTGPAKWGKSTFINELLGHDILFPMQLETYPSIEIKDDGITEYYIHEKSKSVAVDRKTFQKSLTNKGSQKVRVLTNFPKDFQFQKIIEAKYGQLKVSELSTSACILILLPVYGWDRKTQISTFNFLKTIKKSNLEINILFSHFETLDLDQDENLIFNLAEQYSRDFSMPIRAVPWRKALIELRNNNV